MEKVKHLTVSFTAMRSENGDRVYINFPIGSWQRWYTLDELHAAIASARQHIVILEAALDELLSLKDADK